MNLQDTLERVEASKAYTFWKKENESAFLSSFFKIVEEAEKKWWQLDFYNPKSDLITSFIAEKEIKLVGKNSKVFKREQDQVHPLELDNISIDEQKAINIAAEVLKDKYKGGTASKKIVILQNVGGTIWNISLLTANLRLCNVRIDAASGDVVEDSFKNILEFKAQSE